MDCSRTWPPCNKPRARWSKSFLIWYEIGLLVVVGGLDVSYRICQGMYFHLKIFSIECYVSVTLGSNRVSCIKRWWTNQ